MEPVGSIQLQPLALTLKNAFVKIENSTHSENIDTKRRNKITRYNVKPTIGIIGISLIYKRSLK